MQVPEFPADSYELLHIVAPDDEHRRYRIEPPGLEQKVALELLVQDHQEAYGTKFCVTLSLF